MNLPEKSEKQVSYCFFLIIVKCVLRYKQMNIMGTSCNVVLDMPLKAAVFKDDFFTINAAIWLSNRCHSVSLVTFKHFFELRDRPNRREVTFRIVGLCNRLPPFAGAPLSADVFKSRLDICGTDMFPEVV